MPYEMPMDSFHCVREETGSGTTEGEKSEVSTSNAKCVSLRLRYGQGGYRDRRSPLNKLGGGQIAVDIMPNAWPVMFSLSGEYYTNSPSPTHQYEISDLTVLNFFYVIPIFSGGNTNIFFGGGPGILEVPAGEDDSGNTVYGFMLDAEAGINIVLFWKIGIYCIGKYIYSQKPVNNSGIIDFNEIAFLIGISLNFSW